MATSSEAVYDTIVSIALIIDQREGETWTDLISTADSYVDLTLQSMQIRKHSSHDIPNHPHIFSITQSFHHKYFLYLK